MTIHRLTGEDHARYRAIRLESLQADPEAFGSDHQREVAFDEAQWRARLDGIDGRPAAIYVDEVDGLDVGTTGVVYTEHDPSPMLVGMWVRPNTRGLGVGRRLVEAAMEWARDQGADEMLLWVVRDNPGAIGLYQSCGFALTGTAHPTTEAGAPPNPCADELEMRLRLA